MDFVKLTTLLTTGNLSQIFSFSKQLKKKKKKKRDNLDLCKTDFDILNNFGRGEGCAGCGVCTLLPYLQASV